MKILAIESSCDEFSISIIDNNKIITNIISSQIKNHKEFGGVIPELAARLHLESIDHTILSAINESKINIEDIDYIAFTEKPGLIGSLIIGKLVAQTMATYLDKPLIPIHHIEGHIFGASINHNFVYPVLAMVVSGGHTQIELVNSPKDFVVIGATLDDAIGECYDKVARVLGFEYPGGPFIDKAAQEGNGEAFKFTPPKDDDSYDFSYSGLKTSVINTIHNLNQQQKEIPTGDIAASFQKAATSIIAKKLEKAIVEFKPKTLTIAGGVSANSELRKMILKMGEKHKIQNTFVPEMQYCTDNAAMIAKLAYEKIKSK